MLVLVVVAAKRKCAGEEGRAGHPTVAETVTVTFSGGGAVREGGSAKLIAATLTLAPKSS